MVMARVMRPRASVVVAHMVRGHIVGAVLGLGDAHAAGSCGAERHDCGRHRQLADLASASSEWYIDDREVGAAAVPVSMGQWSERALDGGRRPRDGRLGGHGNLVAAERL